MKIGQAAKILSVSTTTIRNYLKFGNQYFSESATRQKGKNISSWDLNQLEEIQHLLGEGVKFDQIPEHLAPIPDTIQLDEPVFISPEPAQDNSALITPSLIEQIHQVYQLTLDAKDAQLAELKADKDRLQTELDRRNTPWWKKLFK
jgi:DNA-binding transcriptional MerR regulator